MKLDNYRCNRKEKRVERDFCLEIDRFVTPSPKNGVSVSGVNKGRSVFYLNTNGIYKKKFLDENLSENSPRISQVFGLGKFKVDENNSRFDGRLCIQCNVASFFEKALAANSLLFLYVNRVNRVSNRIPTLSQRISISIVFKFIVFCWIILPIFILVHYFYCNFRVFLVNI